MQDMKDTRKNRGGGRLDSEEKLPPNHVMNLWSEERPYLFVANEDLDAPPETVKVLYKGKVMTSEEIAAHPKREIIEKMMILAAVGTQVSWFAECFNKYLKELMA